MLLVGDRKCTQPKWKQLVPLIRRGFLAEQHTHTYPFNSPLSGTTRVSQLQKGNTNLDFTEALKQETVSGNGISHMQVCTSLQTDNHANTPPLSFYRPTNSVKALKAASTEGSFSCRTSGGKTEEQQLMQVCLVNQETFWRVQTYAYLLTSCMHLLSVLCVSIVNCVLIVRLCTTSHV